MDAASDDVVVEEAADGVGDLGARALDELGAQPRGGGELDEVAAARQLPAALGIDALGKQAVAVAALARRADRAASRCARRARTSAEDVDLVAQDGLGARGAAAPRASGKSTR